MQSESGKTFKFIHHEKVKESVLRVSGPIEAFGYKLYPNVSYSMKKKGRWQLPELLTTQYDNEELPIIYSKHQCIYNLSPILDHYLYDSITDTKVGSLDVSNQGLQKGSFNMRSIVHQIENRNNYTEKELRLDEKLKKQNKSIYTSRPLKNEHFNEKNVRKDCVHLEECVHIKNLAKVNMVRNYPCFKPWYYKHGRKRMLDNYDLEYESNEEELEKVEVIDEEERRPFILAGDDFLCRDKENNYKEKSRKKKKKTKKKVYILNEDNNQTVERSVIFEEEKVDKEEIWSIIIDLPKDVFKEEIKTLNIFCRCWISESKPWTLMIDLDQFDESENKSFILIQPNVDTDEELICVKIMFNIENNAVEKEDVVKFTSLLEVVSLIQSRLKSQSLNRIPSFTNMHIFDGFIEGSNLQKVKKLDNPNSLFLHHKEWKSCNFESDKIEILTTTNINYFTEECNICNSVTPDDELMTLRECNHQICVDCLTSYILRQLNNDKDDMTCPSNNCFTLLNAPTILSLIPWRLYSRRLSILELNLMKEAGKPCYECGAVFMNIFNEHFINKNDRVEYLCECGRHICYNCGELQHWPSSCQEMKNHNLKIIEFKDKEKTSKSSPANNNKNTCCSNCNTWTYSYQLKKSFQCICLKSFCENCRIVFESHVDSCKISLNNEVTFPHSSEVIPFQRPKSAKLKLYNHSLYLNLLRRPTNINQLKEDIRRITSTTAICRFGSQSVKELENSYSQVLRILESMFVAAYNYHQRNDPKKYHLLKVSTNHVLFYVMRIHRLKNEIHELMKEKLPKEENILKKYTFLENDVNASKVYIDKIISLL